MANVTTIDITPINGNDKFPLHNNDVYSAVEKLAVQKMYGLKSTNRIVDGFHEYAVENGAVVEESALEMAVAGTFTKTGAPSFAPHDPKLFVKYFNNWETKQFATTIRRTDIKKIIANKGEGLDDIVAKILDSITEGEGYYDFTKEASALATAYTTYATNVNTIATAYNSKKPKTIKGAIFLIREAYNALKATNKIGVGATTDDNYRYAVDPKDIRIAISESTLNMIDVTELANVFNLSKEELFGRLVVVPFGTTGWEAGKVLVYDVRAMGRATNLYEYSQDVVGVGLYTNHYLTTERCYFINQLFKMVKVDATSAVTTELGELLEAA